MIRKGKEWEEMWRKILIPYPKRIFLDVCAQRWKENVIRMRFDESDAIFK